MAQRNGANTERTQEKHEIMTGVLTLRGQGAEKSPSERRGGSLC